MGWVAEMMKDRMMEWAYESVVCEKHNVYHLDGDPCPVCEDGEEEWGFEKSVEKVDEVHISNHAKQRFYQRHEDEGKVKAWGSVVPDIDKLAVEAWNEGWWHPDRRRHVNYQGHRFIFSHSGFGSLKGETPTLITLWQL